MLQKDDGANERTGIKGLVKYGVCPEDTWPYNKDPANYTNLTLKALEEGLQFISKWFTYWRIRDPGEENVGPQLIEHMEAALSEGFPIIFGFRGSDDNAPLNAEGILEEQGLTDEFVYAGWVKDGDNTRGHAVLVVGFDRAEERFLILNSLGKGFGNQGYFYMPYRWFKPDEPTYKDGKLGVTTRVDDFWVLKTQLPQPGTAGSDVTPETSVNQY